MSGCCSKSYLKKFNNLSEFTALNAYSYYFMNKYTANDLLHFLNQLAQEPSSFTVSTLLDTYTETPAIIVVEIIDPQESVIVFVETCHLPHNRTSLQFWLIKSFVKTVLKSEQAIFAWENPYDQLSRFLHCGLFTRDLLDEARFVDVRAEYLEFDFRLFKHYRTGVRFWPLEKVIDNIFNEFLDQRESENIWSQGFYQPFRGIVNHRALQPLVQYAINACLAVTKLVHFMRIDAEGHRDP